MATLNSTPVSPAVRGFRSSTDSPSRRTFAPRHLTVSSFTPTPRYVPPHEREPGVIERPRFAPWLRVAGKWLKEAGFDIGTQVRVEVSHGRLIIEAVPEVTAVSECTSPRRRRRKKGPR